MEEEILPPVRSELAHRPVQVGLRGADRQAEKLGDRPIREATGSERGHLGFAAGYSRWGFASSMGGKNIPYEEAVLWPFEALHSMIPG